jgi:ribonuclease D
MIFPFGKQRKNGSRRFVKPVWCAFALARGTRLTQSRRLIETQVQLKEFLPELRKTSWASLDTEADSLHSYPEKLCLLQISLPSADMLVDPLAALDLTPLFKALANKELLIHGCDNDLRLMYAANRFVPARVFDTMWAARLLGFTAFGLNDLLSKLIGITLDKGSQKANWTRRPLTEKMTIYALNDSRHLRALADKLRDALNAKGRITWHQQICERLVREHAAPKAPNPDQAWRLKGSSKLNRHEQAILRAAWQWRECEAVDANKPPYFIVRHEDLVQLAGTLTEKKRKTAWPPKLSNRRFKSLRDAVSQALNLPPSEHPETPRTVRRRITQSEKLFYESLKVLRDKQAKALNIDPTLIASRSTLVKLSLEDGNEHDQILPWQRELLNL